VAILWRAVMCAMPGADQERASSPKSKDTGHSLWLLLTGNPEVIPLCLIIRITGHLIAWN